MKKTQILAFLFLSASLTAQDLQPKRPQNFTPYNFRYTIEELYEKFSEQHISDAKQDMDELNEVNEKGVYKPDYSSLDEHPMPEWYVDAKLGIFFDWGLYSIAGYDSKEWKRARYPDWYLNHMYSSSSEYHENTWGADFQRDDFIGLFDAKNLNPRHIVQLMKECGARYFVPFCKHHDGFCLWNSKYTFRDATDMNPNRDVCMELFAECEKNGLKYGFYFSVDDYEYPVIDSEDRLKVRLWAKHMAPKNTVVTEADGEFYVDFNSGYYNKLISGKIPVKNFIDEYIVPQAKDFIDHYSPDILWFDGEWQRDAEYYKTPEIVAYFYNRAIGKKEVVANDRLGKGARRRYGDFYTSETDEVTTPIEHPWEENRSMSESYGYNWSDSLSNYLTSGELIQMVVRIVAKGGNLNLIVNPDGSGRIPDLQVNLLKELGEWLKINGEAIYGSRTYEVMCDNTQLGQPVWYTRSKDAKHAYAICFDWPKSETFVCPGGNPKRGSKVYMLGYDKPLEWVDLKSSWGLVVKIPEEMLNDPSKRPCKNAWVLKFEWDRENEF